MASEIRLLTFILVTTLATQFSSSNPILETPRNGGKIWALLIAGSNGYGNYRHQADVSHAYQILHSYGIPDENIVVMMYDDIANDPENPYPGKIINKPNGEDVYAGVLKDYTGDDVNKANFLNILKGNKKAMKNIGSGKVIESGPNDHVFVNFVDHGSVGLLAIIDDYLYADELLSALKYMHNKNKFQKLLLYIEACEAGSMFQNLLPNNIKILASTASNAEESSWGCYCNVSPFYTCLGDLYSVTWMEHLDSLSSKKENKETILTQYKYVKKYVNESHVMLYGDKAHLKSDKIHSFVGSKTSSSELSQESNSYQNIVPSREAGIELIKSQIKSASTEAKKKELNLKLKQLEKMRAMVDQTFTNIVNHVALGKNDETLSDILNKPSAVTLEVMPCYKEMIQQFNEKCFNSFKNSYVLRYFYILYNMCSMETINKEDVVSAFQSVCNDNIRSVSGII